MAAKDLPRIPRISRTISVGTLYLASLNARLEGAVPKLFYSVTRKSSDGTVYLKLINASSTPQPGRIQLDGARVVGDGKLTSQQFGTPFPTVLLRGLAEHAVYKVEAIDPGEVQEVGTVSGAYLMPYALNLNLRGDYDSTSVLKKQ